MKKSLMLFSFAVTISISVCGQKLDPSKVPELVKKSFTAKYSGLSPKWEKEDGKYEATFKQEGKSMSAMFMPNGSFIESELDIKVTELPASVLAYVNEHYKGKTIKGASKITKADGAVNFEAGVNGRDVIFDTNGKFINEINN